MKTYLNWRIILKMLKRPIFIKIFIAIALALIGYFMYGRDLFWSGLVIGTSLSFTLTLVFEIIESHQQAIIAKANFQRKLEYAIHLNSKYSGKRASKNNIVDFSELVFEIDSNNLFNSSEEALNFVYSVISQSQFVFYMSSKNLIDQIFSILTHSYCTSSSGKIMIDFDALRINQNDLIPKIMYELFEHTADVNTKKYITKKIETFSKQIEQLRIKTSKHKLSNAEIAYYSSLIKTYLKIGMKSIAVKGWSGMDTMIKMDDGTYVLEGFLPCYSFALRGLASIIRLNDDKLKSEASKQRLELINFKLRIQKNKKNVVSEKLPPKSS